MLVTSTGLQLTCLTAKLFINSIQNYEKKINFSFFLAMEENDCYSSSNEATNSTNFRRIDGFFGYNLFTKS